MIKMLNEIHNNFLIELENFINARGITGSKTKFKCGIIEINGVKISITAADDIDKMATKINFKKATWLEAEQISNELFLKLLIKSKDKILSLNDPGGSFASFFKKGNSMDNKDFIIQIIKNCSGQESSNITLHFTCFNENQRLNHSDSINEVMKLHLAKM